MAGFRTKKLVSRQGTIEDGISGHALWLDGCYMLLRGLFS
jgi:hypothetical protein